VDELGSIGVCAEPPARGELGHLGVDRRHATLARERHPVVAVDHEVRVAELLDDDRRKRIGKRLGDSAPALPELGPERVESVDRSHHPCCPSR
jgi:hypothetical protein